MRRWGVLLLLSIVADTAAAAAAAAAANKILRSKDCPDHCGNVSIPYPFGIGPGCFLDGFEITCVKNDSNKPFIGRNIEVINISLVPAQVRAYKFMAYTCYDQQGNIDNNYTSKGWINITGSPYRFSNTLNKFTVVGCYSSVYLESPSPTGKLYASGCLSYCEDETSVQQDGSCSGMGCCQTSIPKGLDNYHPQFDTFNHSYVWNFNPCSYAFLVEEDSYKFEPSDVKGDNVFTRYDGRVPMVLDWAIRNETCEQAKQNQTAYACISDNSECVDSTNGPGYICNCSSGYQGNPYLTNGCKDVDECKNPKQYSCYGNCQNNNGSFICSCPRGHQGNPKENRGCQMKLWVALVIGGFGIFIFSSFLYMGYILSAWRAKRNFFEENGGLLLLQQMSAHMSDWFKVYTLKELERATNNFDESQRLGGGGQGSVYRGVLDDGKRVAVKKPNGTDYRTNRAFGEEMHIISHINHKNVIKILGCCLEVEVPILVYELMPNGTLADCIHNLTKRISLHDRLKLAIESAKAIEYLHFGAKPSIVHGDIKPTNILLDDNNSAVITDFGLSRLSLLEATTFGFTHGYVDYESFEQKLSTEKTDVFAFAVVLLEILTRKEAVYRDPEAPGRQSSLAEVFGKRGLEEILDNEIRCEFENQLLILYLDQLLAECLHKQGEKRPHMEDVVKRLERLKDALPPLEENNAEDVSNYTTKVTQYLPLPPQTHESSSSDYSIDAHRGLLSLGIEIQKPR